MLRVIVASPYSGDTERNTAYARRCLLDSFDRGEAPMASHLLYPQVLDDTDPRERERALQAEYEWIAAADIVAFYVDYGWSPGMIKELKVARLLHKIKINVRMILEHPTPMAPDEVHQILRRSYR